MNRAGSTLLVVLLAPSLAAGEGLRECVVAKTASSGVLGRDDAATTLSELSVDGSSPLLAGWSSTTMSRPATGLFGLSVQPFGRQRIVGTGTLTRAAGPGFTPSFGSAYWGSGADSSSFAELRRTLKQEDFVEVDLIGGDTMKGRVSRVEWSHLILRFGDRTMTIPEPDVTKVRVRRGNRVWVGLLLGTLVGAAVGLVVGSAAAPTEYDYCTYVGPNPGCYGEHRDKGTVGTYAGVGAIAGELVGGIIGGSTKRYETVYSR